MSKAVSKRPRSPACRAGSQIERRHRVAGRILAGFTPLLPLLVAAACTAPSGGAGPAESTEKMRVTLRDYKSGRLFELVSESHTDRVAYYSETRTDASRKIQSDDVMDALVDELRKQGFKRHAQEGRAPGDGGALLTWGLEIMRGEELESWVIGSGSAAADWEDFRECRDTFIQLYNVTAQYQAITNSSGKSVFEGSSGQP